MLAVAFEGCACRVAFHAGVACELVAAGLPIRLVAGSSSGSLAAAAVAAGMAEELPAIVRALGGESVLSLRRARWNRSPFNMSWIVRNALETHLGGLDLRGRPIEALVVATRVPDLRTLVYSSRREENLLLPLLGSCFVPVLYGRPVRHRGDLLVDGGLRDNLPIEVLAERGATDIIAVIPAHDGSAMRRPFAPRLDLSGTGTKPLRVGGAKVRAIFPDRPLRIKSWDFAADRVNEAVDAGHRAARRFLGS